MSRYSIIAGFFCVAGVTASLCAQTPLGTDFVYQGRLQASGLPAVSNADFQFSLFDAVAGGNLIGATLPRNNVALASGVFTTSLDFGAGAFKNEARFLEVAVRSPAGSGGFTTLSPRQALTAIPHAQFALQTRGVRIDAPNGASPNTAMGLESEGGFAEIMRISPDGKVGVGTINPVAPLHIRAFEPALLLHDPGPAALQTGFVSFRNGNLTETGWVGFGSSGSPDFSVLNARTGGDMRFFTQGNERLRITAAGEVHVNGTLTHTPETRSYTVHGNGFIPARQTHWSNTADGIIDESGAHDELSLFFASPHLPDGATLVAMEVIGYDGVTVPGYDIECRLRRTPMSGDSEIMAEVISDTSNSPWRTETIVSPTINNFNAYSLSVVMHGGTDEGQHRLRGVRLIYTVLQPLP